MSHVGWDGEAQISCILGFWQLFAGVPPSTICPNLMLRLRLGFSMNAGMNGFAPAGQSRASEGAFRSLAAL